MATRRYRRRVTSGFGWGYPSVGPAYALLPEESACSCQGASAKSNGVGQGLEQWIKDNPMLAFVGVFAVGMLLGRKKSLF
jgi:hypothetical protein